MTLLAAPPEHAPVVDIADDPGGNVFPRQVAVEKLRRSGEKVRISGECASACTLVLSLPPEQLCVTKDARLGFHEGSNGVATNILWQSYPEQVKGRLAAENVDDQDRNIASIPLTPQVRWLNGQEALGGKQACADGKDLKPD